MCEYLFTNLHTPFCAAHIPPPPPPPNQLTEPPPPPLPFVVPVNHSSVQGFFCSVEEISDTLDYTLTSSSNRTDLYRTVLLRLIESLSSLSPSTNSISSNQLPTSFPAATTASASARFTYLVLYGAQTQLADLLDTGDVLYVHYPYVVPNCQEPFLFGSSYDDNLLRSARDSLTAHVTYTPPGHIRTEQPRHCPFHVQVASKTCLCRFKAAGRRRGGGGDGGGSGSDRGVVGDNTGPSCVFDAFRCVSSAEIWSRVSN